MKRSLLALCLALACAQDVGLREAQAVPLSTASRWVVDESGRRVKLACVNWPAHLEPVLAEGLGKQPVDAIAKAVASRGFNCVRLTWPTFLVTNASLASLTVLQSFQALNLTESLAAIRVHNPSFLSLHLIDAFKAVVNSLGSKNIMVILDNHLSKPGWCCGYTDGNGFFGDAYFNPDVWVDGLTKMATIFAGVPNVVGMSLRNELRGPRQNPDDWYKYMQRGAEAVHAANPKVLVILSGLSSDNELGFLSARPVSVSFTGKLLFELHWYSFSDGAAWRSGNANQVCARIAGNVMRRAGFLLAQGWPLFLSEFGVDNTGRNVNDNRYLGCAAAVAAELDLDWALWALQGSYYVREGTLGLDELYGVLDWAWCRTRNESVLRRIQALQQPFRGPGFSDSLPYKVLFHPATGLCVVRRAPMQPLELGPCNETDAWVFTEQQTLALRDDRLLCLRAERAGLPARLGIMCGDAQSRWRLVSDSRMHVAANVTAGVMLCLDVGADGWSIVTNPCRCLSNDQGCDPERQWFKLVTSTRRVARRNVFAPLPFGLRRSRIRSI